MIKSIPVIKSAVWGGQKLKSMFGRTGADNIAESWELSVHRDGQTETDCGGTLARYIADRPDCVFKGGGRFPVLIKYIDAADKLSVQVHPNDAYARKYENDNGKTEMWYVAEADDGAGIYCGFKRDTDRREFEQCLRRGCVEELLNFIPVKAGDCYLIEAGTVHAICGGCVILEVQQSSNVTYRVYDYDRTDGSGNRRELHIAKAMDVIDFCAFRDNTDSGAWESVGGSRLRTLTECDYFICKELLLDGSLDLCDKKSFTAVNVVSGSGSVGGKRFNAGDSFFAERGEPFTLEGKATVILTSGGTGSCYIGIDLGGTFIKSGLVDGDGNIIVKDRRPTPYGYEDTVAAIGGIIDELTSGAHRAVSGVGIGCPGLIDGKAGTVLYSNNLQWSDKALVRDLSRYTTLPVRITNDANAAALGECFAGAGKKYDSMVMLTLGTGVGSGIVIDGKLFEGNRGQGGELGHTLVRQGGAPCSCGRRGCLEAYASVTALIERTKRAMLKDRQSALWRICPHLDDVSGKTAFDGAECGDRTAKRVVAQYIDCLADGVANIINAFRPQAIVLGGGASAQGDALTVPLARKVKRLIFGGDASVPVEIVVAELKNDAGICGAARLAMDAV